MEIPLSLIPSFFWERVELVIADIRRDFDCRFADTRKRRLLEFHVRTQKEPTTAVLEEPEKNRSFWDWDDLFEWNERLDDEYCLHLLAWAKKRLDEKSEHELFIPLSERIQLMETFLTQYSLGPDPHWGELFYHRWKASLWREECRALTEIIERVVI